MNALDPVGTGQLSWRCRRGMRELDLILADWLRERWPVATPIERRAFERFLELPDPLLAGYLLHDARPDDPGFQQLVRQMRGGCLAD